MQFKSFLSKPNKIGYYFNKLKTRRRTNLVRKRVRDYLLNRLRTKSAAVFNWLSSFSLFTEISECVTHGNRLYDDFFKLFLTLMKSEAFLFRTNEPTETIFEFPEELWFVHLLWKVRLINSVLQRETWSCRRLNFYYVKELVAMFSRSKVFHSFENLQPEK